MCFLRVFKLTDKYKTAVIKRFNAGMMVERVNKHGMLNLFMQSVEKINFT